MRAKVDRLAVVCENFFKGHGGIIDGFDCHTIEVYYRMTISEEEYKNCKYRTDEDEELVWLNLEEIQYADIKPCFIKERIREILENKETIHVVEERDRR